MTFTLYELSNSVNIDQPFIIALKLQSHRTSHLNNRIRLMGIKIRECNFVNLNYIKILVNTIIKNCLKCYQPRMLCNMIIIKIRTEKEKRIKKNITIDNNILFIFFSILSFSCTSLPFKVSFACA